ncbi:hypothetical protein NBRC3299_0246 [Acetobacter pasteurianus NBRC 3299]|nr:hypothetical protein BBA71_02035 [Acetobacter pasteurianus]GCD73954.1 hypothetical protein NBRC3299_0246 [Acetobacter pasteurianus NBRC 3299]
MSSFISSYLAQAIPCAGAAYREAQRNAAFGLIGFRAAMLDYDEMPEPTREAVALCLRSYQGRASYYRLKERIAAILALAFPLPALVQELVILRASQKLYVRMTQGKKSGAQDHSAKNRSYRISMVVVAIAMVLGLRALVNQHSKHTRTDGEAP